MLKTYFIALIMCATGCVLQAAAQNHLLSIVDGYLQEDGFRHIIQDH